MANPNQDILYRASRSLLPKGYVFNLPEDSLLRKLFIGTSDSLQNIYDDSRAVLHQLTPLNEGFSLSDATPKELSLWLPRRGDNLDFEKRKQTILEAMGFPNEAEVANSPASMQQILRNIGFNDIYVFDNRFDDGFGGVEAEVPIFTAVTSVMADVPTPEIVFMDDKDMGSGGESFMGRRGNVDFTQLVYNSILPDGTDKDITFPLSEQELKRSFWISGGLSILPEQAYNLESYRELELRFWILSLKSAYSICLMNLIKI